MVPGSATQPPTMTDLLTLTTSGAELWELVIPTTGFWSLSFGGFGA